jgi:hypothetical protein
MTVYSCTNFDIAGLVPIPSSTKTLLEKLVQSLGDVLLQPPPFHPEFQAIECVYRDVAKEVRRTNVPGVSRGIYTEY